MMKKKKKLNDDLILLKSQNQGDILPFKKEDFSISKWEMFVRAVVAHVDPVLASMLYATEFVEFDQSQKIVRVATLKKFVLFQDLFIEQKKIYQEYLDRIFGFQTMLIVNFINTAQPVKTVVSLQSAKNIEQPITSKADVVKNSKIEKRRSFDISDQKKWKVTHALLEHFGGTVKEIIKDTHEFDA